MGTKTRSAIVFAAISLTACQGGRTPSELTPLADAAGCLPTTDHTAESLAWHLTPRPGPEVLYAAPPRAPQLENTGRWTAPAILISGAQAYRCGEFVYQDWLFDDHGAALTPDPQDPQAASAYLFSPKFGTLTYPTDPAYANNAADLVEFRVKPASNHTAFRITVNTLLDPERLGFTLALGDDTPSASWPHGAGVQSPASLFLTVHGQHAELRSAATDTLVEPSPVVSIDLERRQIEVIVSHAAWHPARDTIRMALGLGLWDSASNAYLQAGPTATAATPGGGSPLNSPLFNMAFRGAEPTPDFSSFSGRTIADAAILGRAQGHWWRERLQSEALQNGDVSAFFAEVDFAKLSDGINDESTVPQSGFMNRIFASRFAFGQGVDYDRECGGVSAARPCDGAMVGQLQPYSLYVPDLPEPTDGFSLTMMPHALSANLNQYLGSRHARQLGDRGDGSIVATPAGRGPDGFYFDVAEADFFEVWSDVARHYRLDPDRVTMTGISMGGIGSFRLATRYPDLFARIMPVVAASTDYMDMLPSLLNVPVMMWTCLFDELQNVSWTEDTITALTSLGYRLDSYRFETWDHLSPSTNDDYAEGAAFLEEDLVIRNPSEIHYVLVPAEDETRVHVIADKAYWLSGLRSRDGELASVEAYSEGLGKARHESATVVQTSGLREGGNLEPAPFTRRPLDWQPPQDQTRANRLHLKTRNLSELTVHPERAGLNCDAEILLDSDGPLQLTLAGCGG